MYSQSSQDHRLEETHNFTFKQSILGGFKSDSETSSSIKPLQITDRQGRPGSSGGSAVLLPFVGAERMAYLTTAQPLLPQKTKYQKIKTNH